MAVKVLISLLKFGWNLVVFDGYEAGHYVCYKFILSRFINNPSQTHFGAAKRLLRYIQGTLD